MFLTSSLVTDIYPLRLMLLITGITLLSLGVYTVVLTDVVMNAPDGLVKTISNHWGIEFSNVKTIFDIVCVSTSVILSLLFFGKIIGLREGTIIAALSIGKIIGVISRKHKHKIMALYT